MRKLMQTCSWAQYAFLRTEFAIFRLPAPVHGLSQTEVEIAHGVEATQDGRIHIEKINGPFLYQLKGTPTEYKAGLDRAISNGWLWQHESGTYVKFTESGAILFA